MTLEEMLTQAIPKTEDEKYVNIHDCTHKNDILRDYIHEMSIYLLHSGYPIETAVEMGMLWVLDAITLFGMPDNLDSLRVAMPTPEELESTQVNDANEFKQAQQQSPENIPQEGLEAFEKLLGDIDIPEFEDEGANNA